MSQIEAISPELSNTTDDRRASQWLPICRELTYMSYAPQLLATPPRPDARVLSRERDPLPAAGTAQAPFSAMHTVLVASDQAVKREFYARIIRRRVGCRVVEATAI